MRQKLQVETKKEWGRIERVDWEPRRCFFSARGTRKSCFFLVWFLTLKTKQESTREKSVNGS